MPNPERSGQWQEGSNTFYFDQIDNYASALNYANLAQQKGFTKLIFDSGLKYLYTEYRHWLADNSYQTPYHSINDVRSEIDRHLHEMSQGGIDRVTGNNVVPNSIICHPYVDEPDYFAQERSTVQGPSGPLWGDYTAGIPELVKPTAQEYVAALNNLSDGNSQIYNAINRDIITEFRDLVNYTIIVASSYGRILFIATTTPDIIHRCNPLTQDCSSSALYRRDDFAGYHYDSAGAVSLISSLYQSPYNMSKHLPAIRSNYNKPTQELINFWDRSNGYGSLPGAPTAQDIIDQINVNSPYTGGENWFYQGDCISFDYHDPVHGVSSLQQWNRLLDAIHSFGTRPRC